MGTWADLILDMGFMMENEEIGCLTIKKDGSGPASWAEHRWHENNFNRYPVAQEVFDNIPCLIRENIIVGYLPKNSILSAADNVLTFGSCFAAELRSYLSKVGFAANNFWIPSGLNNTFAIMDFVSWCVTGNQTAQGYRYDRSEEGAIVEWQPGDEREHYIECFKKAGAFVFTLGLAEVWEDKLTGEIFWRGVPECIFDANRHYFRLTTVEENKNNLLHIIKLIRQVNSTAPIILTLSPVPLKATFRPISCVTADCVSKSILRVALDQITSEQLDSVYYWPSFEIVKWVGAHSRFPAYGEDDKCVRHVNKSLVVHIISSFIHAFYRQDAVSVFDEKLTQDRLECSPCI